MGAKITIEGKAAIITGVDSITGASVSSKDLRGGASLVLAGLAADGETRIDGIRYIERGYENFDENLRNLGATINKI